MTNNQIHLHQAQGVAVLTQAHVSRDKARTGLESLTVFRWRDQADVEGQDSAARILNYLSDHPDMVAIEVDGELVPVDASPDRTSLRTRGADPGSDPLLRLPHFGNH